MKQIKELAKLGTYNGFEFNEALLNELLTNSEEFPIVNGHESRDKRPYEPNKNYAKVIEIKDGALIGELDFDEEAQLTKDYIDGKYKKWSIVIGKSSNGYHISELGLLGNHPPAIRGLKDLTKQYRQVASFSEDINYEIEIELKKNNEDIMDEESKKMIEALKAENEMLKAKLIEYEAKEKGADIEAVKAEFSEKLSIKDAENSALKKKIKDNEDLQFAEIIKGADEKTKPILEELKLKFSETGDVDGFKKFASLVITPTKKVIEPLKFSENEDKPKTIIIDPNKL